MVSTIRRLLGNLALAVLSLGVAFALGEAVVRIFKGDTMLVPRYHTDYKYGRYTLRGIRAHADFWHTTPAGAWRFTTNSKGFRDTRDFPYAKPAGTLRVLSLGDSHTQGYEVRQDQTYSAVLERYLAHKGKRVEVLNTGVSGYGTAEALAFLEAEGHRYQPDVVVLAFFGNDYEDNLKSGLFGLDAKHQLVELKYEHIPGVRIQNLIYGLPGIKWLSENSYFYSMLFNGVWNFFKARLQEQATTQAVAATPSAPGGAAPAPGASPRATAGFDYAVPTSAMLTDQQTELAAALVVRMSNFCRAHGARLIVADLPLRPQPYRYASSLAAGLTAQLDAAGVEYVPADSLFAATDGAADLHVPHGLLHISEYAHTVIGLELGRRISSDVAQPKSSF